MVTMIVSSVENMTQEKKAKEVAKKEIKDAAKSYKYSVKDAASNEIMAFLKNYIAIAMKDKLAADDAFDDKVQSEDLKHLFTFHDGQAKLDIYIRKSYLKKIVYAVDPPELIEGFVVTIIVFLSIIIYSERKRQTLKLRRQYETETAKLTNALREHEALALLGRMTATLAHEMKTPIATISNLIHTLPSRIQDKKFTERFIAIAKEELHRTQQLIDNLLVYGKDISDTHNEWVNMKELTQGLTKNAGIKISCPNMGIYGDAFYLRLLFENLIRNSIQANAYEICIRIHANPAHDGLTTDIMFEDNGRGFPQDSDLSVLVNPFVTMRSSGAGLGLFLAQKIMLAHEGAIELYPLPKGAGVKILFPPARIRLYE